MQRCYNVAKKLPNVISYAGRQQHLCDLTDIISDFVVIYFPAPCSGPDVWRCAEGRCISPNLHCDNIAHCTDASDELINCNNTGKKFFILMA